MIILADDLSGAQECAAAAMDLTPGELNAATLSAATMLFNQAIDLPEVDICAVDVNSRSTNMEEAIGKTELVLRHLPSQKDTASSDSDQVFFKFDSLLRGNIAAQLGAASKELGPVVFCPAVPALNRVVDAGVVRVNGVPLHETGLWHLESVFAAESVSAVFNGLDAIKVSLEQARSGELASVLQSVSPDTQVVICDAETDEDLDALATAIQQSRLAAAGASGLCAALARVLPPATTAPVMELDIAVDRKEDSGDADALFVIGTASEQARAQVKRLSEEGIPVVAWQPGSSVELPDGDCVVTVSGPVRAGASAEVDQGLAQLVARNHRGRDLFLTGGQTARSILDALEITQLHPLSQPEFGTVISRTPNGRLIATRPGSFGSTDNLLLSFRAFKHLRAHYAPNERTSS